MKSEIHLITIKIFLEKIYFSNKRRIFRSAIYAIISCSIGIILGWIFRVPKIKLLDILYNQDSEWRKEITLEYYRKTSSFFSSEYFYLNWPLLIISSLAIFLLLIFFNDTKLRQYFADKLSFKDERETPNNTHPRIEE